MNKSGRVRRGPLAAGAEYRESRETEQSLLQEMEIAPDIAPRPHRCRSYTRKKLARAMPRIVAKFVEEAAAGSVPHTNFLAAFGGFDRRPEVAVAPAARKPRGKSVARMLLDEVEAYEARNSITPPASGNRSEKQ
jgi:hypothetical protein